VSDKIRCRNFPEWLGFLGAVVDARFTERLQAELFEIRGWSDLPRRESIGQVG